jgi:hypothetical protein
MLMRIVMLGAAILTAACAGSRGTVAVPGVPGATIPRAVASALSDRWDDWQIVAPGAEAAACASRFSDPPAAVATGDWNGDGTADLAFQITAPDGRRVVAAFARLDGEYVVSEVTPVPDAGGVLGVERRAGSYRHQADGAVYYFSLDTLAFGACNQPEMAYFWTGTAFEGRAVFE